MLVIAKVHGLTISAPGERSRKIVFPPRYQNRTFLSATCFYWFTPLVELLTNQGQDKNQDLSIDNVRTDTVSILIQIDTIIPVFIKHRAHISHSTLFHSFFCISMTFDIFLQGVAFCSMYPSTRWRSQAIPRL